MTPRSLAAVNLGFAAVNLWMVWVSYAPSVWLANLASGIFAGCVGICLLVVDWMDA